MAFHIHVTLATHYSGASQSGIIRPSTELMLHQSQLSEFEYAGALASLIKSGHWKVIFATDSLDASEPQQDMDALSHEEVRHYLLNRGIYKIDRYLPTFHEQVVTALPWLKTLPGSLNHCRLTGRYTGMKAGLATSIQDLVNTRIKTCFNDLGFRTFGKTPFNYVNGKIMHQTWFRHNMLNASSFEEVENLASVRELTEDMVASSFQARFSFAEMAERFDLGSTPAAEITKAISVIRRAGFFSVSVEATKEPRFGLVLILTPTKKTHDIVWDYDFHRGMAQHQWEKEHGHVPDVEPVTGNDPYVNLAPLGYHYLYLLKSKNRYLSVGQTTQPLKARLRIHQVRGTTIRLENLIRQINLDPNDSLEIVYAGMVHHSVCAEHEMRTLWKMQELGHDVVNDVDDIMQNLGTIQLDRRYDRYTPRGKEYVLRKALEQHGEVIELLPLPGETKAELPIEPTVS